MQVKTKQNPVFITKNHEQKENGFLIPIYNIHEGFYPEGVQPQQTYLTVISPKEIKGPHLHFIRTGCFTCIKGNVRFVLKVNNEYKTFYSGDKHSFLSVLVPTGVPAALQNLENEDAYILNMPYPAWTPNMNDEHTDDFSDFNFNLID